MTKYVAGAGFLLFILDYEKGLIEELKDLRIEGLRN